MALRIESKSPLFGGFWDRLLEASRFLRGLKRGKAFCVRLRESEVRCTLPGLEVSVSVVYSFLI